MTPDIELERLAVSDFTQRWIKTGECFAEDGKPKWLRTRNAITCFQGMPLDHLPPKLMRRVDSQLLKINKISQRHNIETWDDLKRMPDEDLDRIEHILFHLPMD